MPDPLYVGLALAAAVGITVALRAVPFVATARIADSPLLGDLGRWLPLGAVTILAVYCLSLIDPSGGPTTTGPAVGVLVTAGVHLWRRHIVLSLVLGTTACLLITNLA